MVRVARESDREEFIVGTEVDMLVRLRRENSDKRFYPANPKALCVDMKKITLEKVLRSLEEEQFEIVVPEEIRRRARRAVDAMVDGQWTVGSKQ